MNEACGWRSIGGRVNGSWVRVPKFFDYARHDAAAHGYVEIEAWAAVMESGDLAAVEAALTQAERGDRVMPDPMLSRAIQQNWAVYARRHAEWERLGPS